MNSSIRRSVIKTITWRVIATLTTGLIALIITGEIKFAASIGIIDASFKLLFYYLHERYWQSKQEDWSI